MVYYLFSSLALMYLFIHVEFVYKFFIVFLWILNNVVRIWMVYRAEAERYANERIPDVPNESLVEGLEGEMRLVEKVGEAVQVCGRSSLEGGVGHG